MKTIIIGAISLDSFIRYQNGTLVDEFLDYSNRDNVDVEVYRNTQFYKITKLNDNSNKNREILQKAILSYENFVTYLNSTSETINYKYLWDIVSIPNKRLFPNGLNLLILELINNDITDNLRVICPTNHYSSEYFNINRRTFIVVKNQEYYEPVYLFEDKKTYYEITRTFDLRDRDVLPNIKIVLEQIKNLLNKNCGPLPSLPDVYKFKQNIVLSKLLFILQENNYKLLKQILNYNGKVIGVLVEKDEKRVFIPCFPSSLIVDIDKDISWIDDNNLWTNYRDTVDFLNRVYRESNGKIPSKPEFKVYEDGLIVGILTETNQFVQLDQPEQDTFGDDLRVIEENNYLLSDEKIINRNNGDERREKFIKKIKLETGFFNAFRNTIRILLGEFQNRHIKKQVEQIINNETELYQNKLKILEGKLRNLALDKISFIIYNEGLIESLDNVTSCYNKTPTDCKKNPFCLFTEDEPCKLLIPTTNLINNSNNDEIYFVKLADELIRYQQIKNFIFEPNILLSFSNIKYKLNDDEIIILQSLLNQEYFENLHKEITNTFVKNNSYDNVNPDQSRFYSNDVTDQETPIKNIKKKKLLIKPIEEEDEGQLLVSCKTEERDISSKFADVFPIGSKELLFRDDKYECSFEILIRILNDYSDEYRNIDIKQLKTVLIDEYSKLNDNIVQVSEILSSQGKKYLIKKLKDGLLTLSDLIIDQNYFMTNLDLIILILAYRLPVVFISSTLLSENSKPFLIVNKTKQKFFYFIKIPISALDSQNLAYYRLIYNRNGFKIETNTLQKSFYKKLRESTEFNLFDYLQNFKIKKPKLKIVVEPSIDNPAQEARRFNIKIPKVKPEESNVPAKAEPVQKPQEPRRFNIKIPKVKPEESNVPAKAEPVQKPQEPRRFNIKIPKVKPEESNAPVKEDTVPSSAAVSPFQKTFTHSAYRAENANPVGTAPVRQFNIKIPKAKPDVSADPLKPSQFNIKIPKAKPKEINQPKASGFKIEIPRIQSEIPKKSLVGQTSPRRFNIKIPKIKPSP